MKETIVLYPCPTRGHLMSMVELGKLIFNQYYNHSSNDNSCNDNNNLSITIILSTLPFETVSSLDSYIASVSVSTPSVNFIHLVPPVEAAASPSFPPPPATVIDRNISPPSPPPTNGDISPPPPPIPANGTTSATTNIPTEPPPPGTTKNQTTTKAPPQRSPLDIPALLYEVPLQKNPKFEEALLNLSKSHTIKAVVIDFFCNAAFKVTTKLGIPTYYYLTFNLCGLAVFLYYPNIHKATTQSLKDLDILVKFPGLPTIPSKQIADLCSDRTHRVYEHFMETANHLPKCAGLVVNTFDKLEERPLKAIIEGKCTPGIDSVPPIFCVGPVMGSTENEGDKHGCLHWLDMQPPRSVVFLAFGSMGVFSAPQLKEIAVGLEKSGVRFLWVVRNPPDHNGGLTLTDPSLDSLLPGGFLERTKDRGLVVKMWAPQVAVLNHSSAGGFVTHCGWNSTLEAVSAGVPMVAWPLYAEQKMNRVFLVEEMKVALGIRENVEDGFVSSSELEDRVTELMFSEKGKAVHDRVTAMREAAAAAVSEGGSSRICLAKFVESMVKY